MPAVALRGHPLGGNGRTVHEPGQDEAALPAPCGRCLQDAIQATDRAVVVDLPRSPYISSAGLRALLTVAKDTRQRGGDFAVCQLPEAVRDIFRLSGFDKIIAIYDSRTGALATLGEPR